MDAENSDDTVEIVYTRNAGNEDHIYLIKSLFESNPAFILHLCPHVKIRGNW